MYPILTPSELQLRQQLLLRQEHIALHRHGPDYTRDISSGWSVPCPGSGPPLPTPNVKVELQNQQLWQQFHAETTEMIITKSGRRMFPSIQLNISGLERRERYCVLLEVAPASDRRHKYVGNSTNTTTDEGFGGTRGWTCAGPAEPQPRLDRRTYLHPDSPAIGERWMQHSINFSKLKLTNNAVDNRNNVVLTSMHKYVPRIWIVRCDDISKLRDFYSHPASMFTFKETEFIAVTAYQNENITKLKIDNNPFAKGFRETGQSRCKRKFQHTEQLNQTDERTEDDEGTVSSSESESNKLSISNSQLNSPDQRSKTSCNETSSVDENSVSSCGGIGSPVSFASQNSPFKPETNREHQPRLHRPWIDSSTPCRTEPITQTHASNRDLLFPSYYFPLIHQSLFAQSRFNKLYFPPVTDCSQFR